MIVTGQAESQWSLDVAAGFLRRGQLQSLRDYLNSLPTPWPADAHKIAGIVQAQDGFPERAIESFLAGLALAPDDAMLWNNLALARYHASDFPGSEQAAQEAIKRQPALADAHNHLGMAFEAMGNFSSAELAYRAALSKAPRHALALNNLAKLALDLGNATAALPWAEAACTEMPSNASAQHHRGLALERLGRIDAAREAYQRALAADAQLAKAREGALRVAAFWWRPLEGRHVRLTRRGVEDVDFLRRCAADSEFMRRFHRLASALPADRNRFMRDLERVAVLPPAALGSVDWTVRVRDGEPVGVVSLAALDLGQRRAELLVGFPEAVHRHRGLPLEATLLAIEFAFLTAGLEKIVSLVYGDNPEAQANTLRLGFREEGRLVGHVRLGDGSRVDLWQNGLLKHEALASPRFDAFARHLLGRPLIRPRCNR